MTPLVTQKDNKGRVDVAEEGGTNKRHVSQADAVLTAEVTLGDRVCSFEHRGQRKGSKRGRAGSSRYMLTRRSTRVSINQSDVQN